MIDMHSLPAPLRIALLLANFAVCSALGWACVCRMARMSRATTCARFRAGYTVLYVAATASGFSVWMFNEWPGPGQLGMGAAALYIVALSAHNWRDGPPDYARTEPAPLPTTHTQPPPHQPLKANQ